MNQQLALFTLSSGAPILPVAAPVPVRMAPTHPLASWQSITEAAREVGWVIPVYAETSLLDALRDPDGAFLWEVLWTARFHLETLQQDNARFTISLDGYDQRFFAQDLQPAGILLRLDQS